MSIRNILRTADRQLYEFISGRRVNPPSDEVKRSTIGRYAHDRNIHVLIESGTYEGGTIEALKNAFSKVISIELDNALFSKAQTRFSHHTHISILHGDSARLLPSVLSSLNEPVLFWLDGHYSGTGTAQGVSNTPILAELDSILRHPVRNHVILIDDARRFTGENGYPTIKELFTYIHSYGGDRSFLIEDDIIRILPRGTDDYANLTSYQESWRQSAGRQYRRLRQSVKQLFFGKQSSTIPTRADINTVASFWDARPCNVRHSPKEIGSREYFDEVEARKYLVEPHIPGFADFSHWKNARVLEIGCGIGTDSVNFARAGAEYTGVELSKESLALAKKRFEVFNQNGRLLQADAESLADMLSGESFDLIYSFGVIHHSPHPEKIVAQVHKLLKPGGEFRLMLYSKYSWKSMMIALGLDRPEAQIGCPIADTFSERDVRLLLHRYRIHEIRKDHIFKYRIGPYREYRYVTVPWFSWMPSTWFHRLEKTLGWHTLITCSLP